MEKLSLIFTTYKSEDNLNKTLSSIDKKNYPSIEVIIKDGGFNDRTLDIIKSYAEKSKYEVRDATK